MENQNVLKMYASVPVSQRIPSCQSGTHACHININIKHYIKYSSSFLLDGPSPVSIALRTKTPKIIWTLVKRLIQVVAAVQTIDAQVLY